MNLNRGDLFPLPERTTFPAGCRLQLVLLVQDERLVLELVTPPSTRSRTGAGSALAPRTPPSSPGPEIIVSMDPLSGGSDLRTPLSPPLRLRPLRPLALGRKPLLRRVERPDMWTHIRQSEAVHVRLLDLVLLPRPQNT
jgi:hypothetical protein